MPRSVLLGRVPGPEEALWLEEDLDAVRALLREEKIRCPGCGLPRDETWDPEADGKYRSRPFRCHGCAAREGATTRFREDGGNMSGLHFTVEKLVD